MLSRLFVLSLRVCKPVIIPVGVHCNSGPVVQQATGGETHQEGG